MSPNIINKNGFNALTDCKFENVAGTCNLVMEKTSNYFRLTIKGSDSYLVTNSNPFLINSWTKVYLYNIKPVRSTSTKYIYPVYMALYKNDGVDPVIYYQTALINCQPATSVPLLPGVTV
jgi:hypothetical protein